MQEGSDYQRAICWRVAQTCDKASNQHSLSLAAQHSQHSCFTACMQSQALNFVMLKRDWERDQKDLMRQLHTFVTDETPLRLLIFPEGTTINTKSMDKCRGFAKQVRMQ